LSNMSTLDSSEAGRGSGTGRRLGIYEFFLQKNFKPRNLRQW
jgi:hypothetical protein